MSAMVFNAGVILLCSLPLCQFAHTAFASYAEATPNQCNLSSFHPSNNACSYFRSPDFKLV